MYDSIQIFEEIGKGSCTDETIGELCFIRLFINCNEFWPDNSIDISFPDDVCDSLEIIDSPFFAFFLADVIEHKLKIFTGSAKINLVFSAVVLIIKYLWYLLVDEDVAIYDVEHAPDFIEFSQRVNESQRVEMVNTAYFLNNETSLY